jgi:hypothetical protein
MPFVIFVCSLIVFSHRYSISIFDFDFLVCDIIVFFFARNCRANSDSMVLQVLAYTGNEDAKKIFLDGEVSLDTIKVIAENYIQTL